MSWKVGDRIRRLGVSGIVTDIKTSFSAYYHLDNGTCGECLNELLEGDTNMARLRKTDKEKQAAAAAKETNTLLDAVRFCAPGYKDTGEAYAQHALIWQGWITTYNGIVMYGHKIDTPMQAAPHYGRLLSALKATDSAAVQITQLDPERLTVKQKGFRTVIPCMSDLALVSRTSPDAPIGVLDSRMREGFEAMRQLVSKSGEFVYQASVLLDAGFVAASDGKIAGMFWHGLGFPQVVVPAEFIEAVLKVAKPLVSFGFTPNQSLTFYFEDQSFIRTQLYSEAYRDIQSVMPADWNNMLQLPDTFFAALEKIEPFLDKTRNFVYFHNDAMSTDESIDVGTVVDCPGLRAAPSGLDVDRLLKLKGRITHIDYRPRDKTKFYGENFRGVLCNFMFEHTAETVAAGFAEHIARHDAALANGEDPPAPDPEAFAPPVPPVPIEYDAEPADEDSGWVTA